MSRRGLSPPVKIGQTPQTPRPYGHHPPAPRSKYVFSLMIWPLFCSGGNVKVPGSRRKPERPANSPMIHESTFAAKAIVKVGSGHGVGDEQHKRQRPQNTTWQPLRLWEGLFPSPSCYGGCSVPTSLVNF